MQNLFPVDGETVPKLRFPEFRRAGDWEEARLEDICEFQDGYSFSSFDFVEEGPDTIQVIRITDINNANLNSDKVFFPTTLIEELNLSKYYIEKGDLLLSLTGAAGFNFLLWDWGRAFINQRTMKIDIKDSDNLALKVLLEVLLYEKINAHGTGQNNNLSKDVLRNIIVCFPKPAEQQQIANSLTPLNNLITAQSYKIDVLKSHKKGIMQQLFPSANVVVE